MCSSVKHPHFFLSRDVHSKGESTYVWDPFASVFLPAICSVTPSMYKPQNYDQAGFRSEKLAFEVSTAGRNGVVVPVEEIGLACSSSLI